MAEVLKLEAMSPCAGLLPLKIGKTRATEIVPMAITSVSPFAGQDAAVSTALEAQLGHGLPQVGQVSGDGDARIVWAGRHQFMVIGAQVSAIEGAALTDQSDAWACVALEGQGARDVLARLVPMDLRDTAFAQGAAARTLVAHMTAVLTCSGAERYEIMVFRSMARTLVHDLKEAMETVAAVGGRA